MLWAVGLALFTGITVYSGPDAPTKKTDAIVVFTGQNIRIETGLGMLADGLSDTLLISGVHRDVTSNEIRALWRHPERPLPDCCIDLDYAATNTVENAIETAQWAVDNNENTIRLVTSDYHMIRAMLELRHTLPNTKIYAHPVQHVSDITYRDRLFWNLVFEEYHKVLYRKFMMMFTTHPLPSSSR